MKILVLSMYEDENSVIRMLRLGVLRGYVLKDIRKQELEQALASLVDKGYYYSEMITGKLIHAISHFDEIKTEPCLSFRSWPGSASGSSRVPGELVCSELKPIRILRTGCV